MNNILLLYESIRKNKKLIRRKGCETEMLTRLYTDSEFKLPTEGVIGYTIEKVDPAPKAGEKLKLYIPTLMSGITKGKPQTKKVALTKKQIFINDASNRPTATTSVITQNYISATMENNCSWKNVAKYYFKTIKYSTAKRRGLTTDNKLAYIYKRIRVYYVTAGKKIYCNIPGSKLSRITFNTTRFISKKSTSKSVDTAKSKVLNINKGSSSHTSRKKTSR